MSTGQDQSSRLYESARAALAGGVNSNVRLGDVHRCFAPAHGSALVDVDGREYIDYALGMGPAILGHVPDYVIKAIQHLHVGQLFAGQHPLELALAELIKAHIRSAELVRLGMTGSEMVQAALRRAIVKSGVQGTIRRRACTRFPGLSLNAVSKLHAGNHLGHAFVQTHDTPLSIGDKASFGISHPCTAFDKWRTIPILDDDLRIVDIAHTFFLRTDANAPIVIGVRKHHNVVR